MQFTKLALFSALAAMAAAAPACNRKHWHQTPAAAVAETTAASSTTAAAAVYSSASAAAQAEASPAANAYVAEAPAAEEAKASPSAEAAAAAEPTPAAASSGGSGDFSGEATYYAVGLGACGNTNSDSEMVVAMNQAQYQGTCGKSVRITDSSTGVSQSARVVDLCPGCAHGDLDMSPTLWSALHGESKADGRFKITWSFA